MAGSSVCWNREGILHAPAAAVRRTPCRGDKAPLVPADTERCLDLQFCARRAPRQAPASQDRDATALLEIPVDPSRHRILAIVQEHSGNLHAALLKLVQGQLAHFST